MYSLSSLPSFRDYFHNLIVLIRCSVSPVLLLGLFLVPRVHLVLDVGEEGGAGGDAPNPRPMYSKERKFGVRLLGRDANFDQVVKINRNLLSLLIRRV